MSRFRWPLLVVLTCLPAALLALGVPLPGLGRSSPVARPRPVPNGDQEMAWIHTSTNNTTWERFVYGLARAQMLVPGLEVDDSEAFLDRTTAAPEVVIGMAGRAGKLRIRWYKITSDVSAAAWVQALAGRDPAPLAFIGGGSTDRAVELAQALDHQPSWHGDRPLLLVTTATADEVDPTTDGAAGQNLIDVYDDRTFRFCFTNRQMAETVLDFVWRCPDLRPQSDKDAAALAAGAGAARAVLPPHRPQVFTVVWEDDPYSFDLDCQFKQSLYRMMTAGGTRPPAEPPPVAFRRDRVPFSVGGFNRPNEHEGRVAEAIVNDVRSMPGEQALLVLPTVTQPARRLLRTICESAPDVSRRLVAVTGDSIPVNAVLRDGEFAWPVHALPVPLVLFTHSNPAGWDEQGVGPAPPPGYTLTPPNSTEDVLLFAELGRVAAEAAFPPAATAARHQTVAGLLTRADDLAKRFRERSPAFFDPQGNRLGGTGEYVVVLRPKAGAEAELGVWRLGDGRSWGLTKTITLRPRGRAAARPAGRDDG